MGGRPGTVVMTAGMAAGTPGTKTKSWLLLAVPTTAQVLSRVTGVGMASGIAFLCCVLFDGVRDGSCPSIAGRGGEQESRRNREEKRTPITQRIEVDLDRGVSLTPRRVRARKPGDISQCFVRHASVESKRVKVLAWNSKWSICTTNIGESERTTESHEVTGTHIRRRRGKGAKTVTGR